MEQSGPTEIERPLVFPPELFCIPDKIRDLRGLPPILARAGSLELRLATTKKDIRKAQRLRYTIFYEEGGATPDARSAMARRDKCPYDRVCDHLLVIDNAFSKRGGETKRKVVGTYRLLRSDMVPAGGFYSANEFDIAPLLRRHRDKRFLELGRSCVHADYRSKRAINLLWHGIALYAAHHGIDVLIGCSSLTGVVPETLAVPLSFAFHFAAASPDWQVGAMPGRATRMAWMEKDAIDPRRAMATLPPLIKAYARAGGTFATEAVIDQTFGTTDLFTVLPLAQANARYLEHFGMPSRPLLQS